MVPSQCYVGLDYVEYDQRDHLNYLIGYVSLPSLAYGGGCFACSFATGFDPNTSACLWQGEFGAYFFLMSLYREYGGTWLTVPQELM